MLRNFVICACLLFDLFVCFLLSWSFFGVTCSLCCVFFESCFGLVSLFCFCSLILFFVCFENFHSGIAEHGWIYSTLLYSTLLYSTILYYTILYYTILYSTLLYSTLLYSTILWERPRPQSVRWAWRPALPTPPPGRLSRDLWNFGVLLKGI